MANFSTGDRRRKPKGDRYAILFFFNFLKISCLTVPFFRVLELVVV
jgi:hypothetical protein